MIFTNTINETAYIHNKYKSVKFFHQFDRGVLSVRREIIEDINEIIKQEKSISLSDLEDILLDNYKTYHENCRIWLVHHGLDVLEVLNYLKEKRDFKFSKFDYEGIANSFYGVLAVDILQDLDED
tara:strand:+ start:1872 stop:2246 length:375 start_codon:yes stop_codon:yes gene_type:complete